MASPSDFVAKRFARTVAKSSDERLGRLVSGWRRRLVLRGIFSQMPRRLNREQAKNAEAVVDWKIKDAKTDSVDHYQLTIKDGKARVTKHPTDTPRATLEMDTVDFVRLAAGVKQGPELFMSGRLKIEGDLMWTASLASLFRVPASP
jgi:putative sterol carrier protein